MYRDFCERGIDWPDIPESVPSAGHNNPPDDNSFEWLQDQIDVASKEAKSSLVGPPISEQAQADKIANLADRLAELWKAADKQRAEERKPHDQAAKEVQLRWAPLLLAAETYKNLKYRLLTPWLLEQQKVKAEKAASDARQGIPVEIDRPKVGTRGRAMSLKVLKRAEIIDFQACLAHFAAAPELLTTVQELANRAVRAGLDVPGVKTIEDAKAV